MNRLLYPLAVLLFVIDCQSEPATIATLSDKNVSDIKTVVKVDRPGTTDPIVRAVEPATLYVIQAGRVRALIEASHAGDVTVPLRSVDDETGPLYYGWIKDEIVKHPSEPLNRITCILCGSNYSEPCCPNQN